tara:strand:+ start:259 stop:642 length:384 start_codon:yes stop_codon:yes gene_type:complete
MKEYQSILNSIIDDINEIVEQYGIKDKDGRRKVDDILNTLQIAIMRNQIVYEALTIDEHKILHQDAGKFADRLFGSNTNQFLMRMSRKHRCKVEFMVELNGASGMSQIVSMLIENAPLDLFGGRNVG